MMLQVGDQFDKYQIRAHVAQGGMADIYTAYDLMNGREVALKIPTGAQNPAQAERFRRELEVMRLLDHPAIQKGLGSGEFDRKPYLVTALVNGQSMRSLIDDRAPLPPGEAISLIRKIAEGIAYAHEREVIHRDLKPENILITPDGQPVIMDFGAALTPGSRRVTYAETSSLGTPDYMAPEQIEGQRGDRRTDVYAVGTMLYELLCGRTPYTGDNAMVVMSQHLTHEAPRLDRAQPGISPQLAAVVARCIARSPDSRYPAMIVLMEALDRLDSADVSALDSNPAEVHSGGSRLKSTLALAVMLAVLILVLIAAFALRGPG